MAQKVYIAGLGAISAIAHSVKESLEAFEKGHSGMDTLSLFPSHHQGQLPVAEVSLSNGDLENKLGIKKTSRTALLGIHAAREAVKEANLKKKWRTGFISGTTVGGMDRTERFMPEWIGNRTKGKLRDVIEHECGAVTERMASDLGIRDFVSTINTACSSSVNAIVLGARLIRSGRLDVVVAGGTDALTKFTLNGFNSLMILDSAPCRPFDAGRAGLNLGEGAGFVVLISEKVRQEENKECVSVVSGYANTNDAFHQTASSPEGRGSYMAMTQALEGAGLAPSDIDYINVHGTGTQNNDRSEGNALHRLFGQDMPPFSSTKSFTGHTLGASGGMEAVFSILAIQHGCLFPNLRFTSTWPEFQHEPVTEFKKGVDIQHVLSNSFGFGGNCSSIIFSRT